MVYAYAYDYEGRWFNPGEVNFFFFFFFFFLSGQILWMSGQMQLCPDIVSGQLLFPSTSPDVCPYIQEKFHCIGIFSFSENFSITLCSGSAGREPTPPVGPRQRAFQDRVRRVVMATVSIAEATPTDGWRNVVLGTCTCTYVRSRAYSYVHV